MSSQSGVASSVELPTLAIWKSAPSAVPPSQSLTFDLFKSGMCHRRWQRRRCSGSLVEKSEISSKWRLVPSFKLEHPPSVFCF